MGSIFSIVALILVFALVVIVHEFGHMLVALWRRVEVTDFAIGLGPSLVSKKIGGIKYHLCALPLGGFVRITGMEPDDPDTERSYKRQPPLAKVAILSAGSIFNIILAFILIFALAFIGFPKQLVMVRDVVPEGPAAEAGFQPGDIVISINGRKIKDHLSLRSAILGSEGRPLKFKIQRMGKELELTVTPRSFEYVNEEGKLVPYNEGKPSIGIMHSVESMVTTKVEVVVPNSEAALAGIKPGDIILELDGEPLHLGSDLYFLLAFRQAQSKKAESLNNSAEKANLQNKPITVLIKRGEDTFLTELPSDTTINSLGILFKAELERLPMWETVKRALSNVVRMTLLFIENLRLLGTKEGLKMMSGPIGIGSIIAQSARSGLYTLIQIAMVITLNLGLINLFPIPPLDGGRIFFVLLEMVGLNIHERKRQIADVVGMFVLLSLIALLTFRDVLGLIRLSF